MKLSEQLKQDHECGDFGKALDGYSERAEALEAQIEELEAKLAAYENWKNWTRSYDCDGKLINEHALYIPKLKLNLNNHTWGSDA